MGMMRSTLVFAVALFASGACAPADEPATSDAPPAVAAPAAPAPTTDLPAAPAPPAPPVAEASPQAAPAAAAPVYLDVRTPAEFQAGHVEGAILIPHDQMAQRWPELAAYQDRELVVYCRSGRRSGLAIEVLRAQGFTKLENGGGLNQMAGRGLPITTD